MRAVAERVAAIVRAAVHHWFAEPVRSQGGRRTVEGSPTGPPR